jgi:hypothetical protein
MIQNKIMPALPPFEIEKRLKKLEVKPDAVVSTALVKKVGDQYEYDKDFIYIAYASALANLSAGAIANQSDATDFQLTPYNTSGVLLAYRGYLINKSIYQSGDPTDYIWESTSGEAGFTSSERYHTTSTGLQETLGNPTKPGTNITWTVINAGTAVPSTAVYVAERFTITTTGGAVTSEWKIKVVGKHIDNTVIKTGGITTDTIASNAITAAKVTAAAITVDKMDLNGTLNVTANSGAIRWGKTDGDDIVNSGLFIGRNSSGNSRFVIGSTNSFIYFNGTTVSAVGVSESATTGVETNFYSSVGNHTFTISPLLGTISIEIAGAGGGGGGTGGQYGQTGGAGGASYVYVKNAAGATQNTFSAAGGSGGVKGGGANVATGGAGTGFGNQGDIGNAASDDTAHGGGAGSTHQQSPAVRPVAGGGGAASGGGGNGGGWSQGVGLGGGKGAYYSTTYTVVDTTYELHIVIGAGGAGDAAYVNSPGDNGGGGAGGAGIVRIKGVLA